MTLSTKTRETTKEKIKQSSPPNREKKSWNDVLEAQWAYRHTNACRCECHCPDGEDCDFVHIISCTHCK